MDNRTERIVIETARHRISGELTLPREGYRSRVSDYLNSSDLVFVALVNVELLPLDGVGEPRQLDFLAVGRDHIELAYVVE